ncbi:MAG: response regulator [Bacteroidota bacterium]|nr:response regulator [Bacteroidota bacterium]
MPDKDSGNEAKSEKPFIKDDREQIKGTDEVILIIEDDPAFARILAKQCHDKGFKCLATPSGEEGFEMAKKHKPHALILDIKLPGISGWQVLDLLKNEPATRHIPVHIMSGEEENLDAYKKGAIGYLTKPIKQDDLNNAFSKLQDFIKRKMSSLLVVEDDVNLRKSIKKLIGQDDVRITDASNGEDALNLIKENKFDCVVLDLGLPDMSGFELIKKLDKEISEKPPVIIYTGKDLTREENEELQKYAETVIIKGVKSDERLVDETALFLHRVVENMPEKQQEMIEKLHKSEDIFKDKKVMLVDDDMRNVFALTKVLNEKGIRVIRAENGKAALDLLEKEKEIDLILMDIMMPVMDGYEAIKNIRKIRQLDKVPIIALTAKAMKEDREKCINAGANDYMTKPIKVDKLLSLMRVWLYK